MALFVLPEAPTMVKPIPRLEHDIRALEILMDSKEPAVQKCRVDSMAVDIYLMCDASRRLWFRNLG